VVSDRGSQFAVEITKELNKMLEIKTKLSIFFYLQTDRQTEQMNQELEQYIRFFIDYRQNDWLEWLVLAEFAFNNKVHLATKVSPFITNYGRELRMRVDIRKKEKVEKAVEFAKRIKKVQEEAGAALRKAQEEMKQQADRRRKKEEEWKTEDKVMLSMKDLVLKEQPAKKLVDRYICPYAIDEVVFTNAVKLQLPTSIRIHLIVNISQVV